MGIPERKEREREERREEIIDAAEKIFFEKGLPQATMDEIADLAELGKSTLYLYYKSKEDLYLAVAMRGAAILRKMFLEAISRDEPTIKLIRNLGDAYYEYFMKYRNYFRMYYFFENPELHRQVSVETTELCFKHDQEVWEVVITPLKRAIDEGLFHRNIDPKQAAVMLWSNANGLMRQIDRKDDYWKLKMNIDLEETMRKSNALLVEAMMTESAKKQYGHYLYP